jgi:hypothetical protein
LSLSEFINIAEGPALSPEASSHLPQRYDLPEMGCTFEEAVNYFREGYKVDTADFVAEIDKLSSKICEEIQSEYIPEVTGEFFDIGRVICGEPEAWFEKTEVPVKNPLNIIINLSVSHNISTEQVKNRGIAICALINLLSRDRAISVKVLMGTEYHKHSPIRFFRYIQIPNNPLDLDLMNFLITHVGFYRRLFWNYREYELNDAEASCYSRPINPPGIDTPDSIYFENIQEGEYNSLEDTKRRVLEILEKLGSNSMLTQEA